MIQFLLKIILSWLGGKVVDRKMTLTTKEMCKIVSLVIMVLTAAIFFSMLLMASTFIIAGSLLGSSPIAVEIFAVVVLVSFITFCTITIRACSKDEKFKRSATAAAIDAGKKVEKVAKSSFTRVLNSFKAGVKEGKTKARLES